ncbi:MAG: tetratricopeptide repeat protein [Candidatus Aminicenantes bacterium]|nr:tetratricopeptide repeat protein [Candidatus Aminicenantes bacterium]
MKKMLLLLLLPVVILPGSLLGQSDQQAFEKAKILIFDRQWQAALRQLDDVIATHPDGRYFAPALFYRAKCQRELGRNKAALEGYETFLRIQPDSPLAEDARISVVDLSAALFQVGEKAYLQKILDSLRHKNKVVSYYAAFKLSYLPERKTAARALPVLLAILDTEKDEELRDRAKIAVMRIDPSRLEGTNRREKGDAGRMLRIRVFDKNRRQDKLSLSLPLALADLALKSLGDEERRELRKKGYDLDRLLEQLLQRGSKIDIQDEEGVIQIWIE